VIGLVGPGTGLGAGGLVHMAHGWQALASEVVTLPSRRPMTAKPPCWSIAAGSIPMSPPNA